ncbi:hypothetical protein V1478_016799 [Vespula squamosa]|uniref:Uncharacterized protein n=1 Tax=Vespula squamosa TaxID=30214 RepID=A0ABD2A0T8_VESSQ
MYFAEYEANRFVIEICKKERTRKKDMKSRPNFPTKLENSGKLKISKSLMKNEKRKKIERKIKCTNRKGLKREEKRRSDLNSHPFKLHCTCISKITNRLTQGRVKRENSFMESDKSKANIMR